MIRRLHSLPGLLLGLVLSLIALSGAVLSVQPTLDRATAAATSTAPPGLTIGEAATAVATAQPGAQTLIRSANGTVTAQVRDAAGPRLLTVDPATGAGRTAAATGPVMRWITSFHRSLMLGDGGRGAVGAMAAAMALLAASGLALLARAMGGWRQTAGPVRAEGARAWHARLGRMAIVALGLSAVTGAWMSAATFGLVPDGTAPVVTAQPAVAAAGGAAAAKATVAPPTVAASAAPVPRLPAAPTAPAQALPPVAASAAPAPLLPAAPTGPAQALPLRDLPALARPLAELRRLALPGRPGDPLRLETADGVALIDPASGTVLAAQPFGLGARVWEWAYRLHTGQGLWAVGLALGLAGLAVPVLAGTGAAIWLGRRRGAARVTRNVPVAEAELVILTGSEGGSTRGFAASLHRALTAAGQRVHLGDMRDLGPMPRARALILMAATYGNGVAPASAEGFLDRLDDARPLTVAVLGFGDRSFPAFCGYAETVAGALAARGWPVLMPLGRIDRQSPAEFAAWGRALGTALGLPLAPEHRPALPRRHGLRLVSRRDYGAAVQAPSVILRFAVAPRWLGGPRFEAGDLLGILAPGATAPRFYSLASASRDGFAEICVRKVAGGVCSTWLHGLQPGQPLRAFIRPNPAFRAPGRSTVMIAAGCGIGPMAGLLRRARPAAARLGIGAQAEPPERVLYFGLRDPASDYLYAEELAAWQHDGRLARLQLAVSRGAAGPRQRGHVQHRLADDAHRLRAQIGRGARVLVCGSIAMGRAVAAEMDALLAPVGLSVATLRAEGRYVEDIY